MMINKMIKMIMMIKKIEIKMKKMIIKLILIMI